MEAYKKAFEPLNVPDDMLDRIMYQATVPAPPIPALKRGRGYPALALAACLALVVCGTTVFRTWTAPAQPTDPVQIVNPIQTVESIDELVKKLPFPLKAPSYLPEGFAIARTACIGGTLAQIIYTSGDAQVTFRMAEGVADISGDYNQYAEMETIEGVLLKGNDGEVSLAVWDDGTYSYSLLFSIPVSTETMLAVCAHVDAVD